MSRYTAVSAQEALRAGDRGSKILVLVQKGICTLAECAVLSDARLGYLIEAQAKHYCRRFSDAECAMASAASER